MKCDEYLALLRTLGNQGEHQSEKMKVNVRQMVYKRLNCLLSEHIYLNYAYTSIKLRTRPSHKECG